MAVKKDYYDILGIDKNADENTIKKAYRKLAKKFHPDTNAGNEQTEQRFKEITVAYNILSNPEKKKLYDQFGSIAFESGFDSEAAKSGAYGKAGNGYREYHFENGNMDDIFGDLFSNMFRDSESGEFDYQSYDNTGFGQRGFNRSGFGSRDTRRRGADFHAEISVSFDEAVFGCDKIIHLQNTDGTANPIQSLQVHIPAGIETGKIIRLHGKGAPGYNQGDPGDLLLNVTVSDKPGYDRKGMDVYTTASIPFTTAVFGGEVLVPTLYGNVMCKISKGTQSGTKIRLRGKGIVSMKNPNTRGDHFVTIQIQVPQNLSPEAAQKLKEYELTCQQQKYRNKNNGAA